MAVDGELSEAAAGADGAAESADVLCARLAHATAAERLDLLIELGGVLTRRALHGDPVPPGATDHVAVAIDVQRQAAGLAQADDPRQADLGWRLGNLHAVRFLDLGGTDADRDAAIERFDDYLRRQGTPKKQRQAAGGWLGVLLMMRVLRLPATAGGEPPDACDLLPLMLGCRLSPDSAADLDKAITVLDQYADPDADGGATPRAHRMAAALHEVSMLFRAVNRPGVGGADMSHTLALLSKESAAPAAADRGSAEVIGSPIWLRAGQAESDPEVIEGLRKAVGLPPYGHLLRATLGHELGLTYADRDPRARAQDDPGADRLRYEDGLRRLADALVTGDAIRPTPAGVEKVVSLAEELLDRRRLDDAAGGAKDAFLLGMALTLRARLTGRERDWARAAERLRRPLELIPDDDPIAVTMLSTLGAVLDDRHVSRGDLADADAASFCLTRAQAIQAALAQARESPAAPAAHARAARHRDLLLLTGLCGVSRMILVRQRGDLAELDLAELDLAATEIQTALDGLPRSHAWRPRLLMSQGPARLVRGALRGDGHEFERGIATLREADDTSVIDASLIDTASRCDVTALVGLTLVVDGALHAEGEPLERGIGKLTAAACSPSVPHHERVHLLCCLGTAHLICHQAGGLSDHLDLGIARLEQARSLFADDPGDVDAAAALWQLATAYRMRADQALDDRVAAIESGRLALRMRTNDVLLLSGTERAMSAARAAAAMTRPVARWCLELGWHAEAIEAMELGRGVLEYAATSMTIVPESLRARGHDELAAAWEAHDAAGPSAALSAALSAGSIDGSSMASSLGSWQLARLGEFALRTWARRAPSGLRRRVLAVLRETGAAAAPLPSPLPSIAEICAALRAVGADAIVYLLPGDADGEAGRLLTLDRDGRAADVPASDLRVDEDGPARVFAAGRPPAGPAPEYWRRHLDELCDWAWPRAIQPLLDHAWGADRGAALRLVLVPSGELGVVPWHAARSPYDAGRGGSRSYAGDRLMLSYAASARRLVDVAGRESPPPIA